MSQRLSMTLHYHSNSATHGRGGGEEVEEGVVKVACESSKRPKKKVKEEKCTKGRRPMKKLHIGDPLGSTWHNPIKTITR